MGYVGIFFVLSLKISTVGGLRCLACKSGDFLSCLQTVECPLHMDRCFTMTDITGETFNKGCESSAACASGWSGACCEGDLCNFTNTSNSIGSSSTVGGIRCYSCVAGDPLSCLKTVECPPSMDRCFSNLTGLGLGQTMIKGCQFSGLCALANVGACCEGDLCNLANNNSIGSSFIRLLLSITALHFL